MLYDLTHVVGDILAVLSTTNVHLPRVYTSMQSIKEAMDAAISATEAKLAQRAEIRTKKVVFTYV